MKEQQVFQQKVEDIKRYLHKILNLETCYAVGEEEKYTILIMFVLNLMIKSDENSSDDLYKCARNLKKWAIENEQHQITMYVAADAIVYLTNDFVLKRENIMNVIALHVAVGDIKEQFDMYTIQRDTDHNIEDAIELHPPYQESHKVL